MQRIRIALAEDHQVVGDALATMLSLEEDFAVEGRVSSGIGIIELVAERRPDVTLMDLELEDMSGIEATRRIVEHDAGARVLVLSMHDDPRTVAQALQSGALGFVAKNAARDTLTAAVRAVAAGDGYLDPHVTRSVLGRVGVGRGDSNGPAAGPLSDQEHRVLEELAHGKSTREIAEAICVSEETVKTHLRHVYQKLGVRDRVQALSVAFRTRLVR